MLTMDSFSFKGRKALVRVDLNVPQDANGHVTDDTRARAVLPTIRKILKDGGKVILMSHLGRPKGGPDPKFSMKVTADHLATLVSVMAEGIVSLEAAAGSSARRVVPSS